MQVVEAQMHCDERVQNQQEPLDLRYQYIPIDVITVAGRHRHVLLQTARSAFGKAEGVPGRV